jgi:4'-phosphopantetheinyl transferase
MTDPLESKTQKRFEDYLSALRTQPITGSELHVWCISLNVSPEDLFYFTSLLAQDETNRAGRYYFENDRNHYIAARGLLRIILGGYLGTEPARIEFTYGPHGKPALNFASKEGVLEFNLSHSKDRVLYAFNWNRKVGVDIEYRIPMADMDDFAEQFFTPRESAFINSLSGDQKEDAFFKTWTCKEAFLKANGSGLTVPINQVEISLEANGTVELCSIGNDKESAAHWRLELFNPFPGYQAALAVDGKDRQIIYRHFGDSIVQL